jgi:hypothetical protein
MNTKTIIVASLLSALTLPVFAQTSAAAPAATTPAPTAAHGQDGSRQDRGCAQGQGRARQAQEGCKEREEGRKKEAAGNKPNRLLTAPPSKPSARSKTRAPQARHVRDDRDAAPSPSGLGAVFLYCLYYLYGFQSACQRSAIRSPSRVKWAQSIRSQPRR